MKLLIIRIDKNCPNYNPNNDKQTKIIDMLAIKQRTTNNQHQNHETKNRTRHNTYPMRERGTNNPFQRRSDHLSGNRPNSLLLLIQSY